MRHMIGESMCSQGAGPNPWAKTWILDTSTSRHVLGILAAGAAIFLSALPAFAAPTPDKKPNFLIIIADDVSWASFGCNRAGGFTRTPNIDTLAGEGLRFTNFFCASAQCTPTRHELITGLLPPSTGVFDNTAGKRIRKLKNLPDHLAPLGYALGYTGKRGQGNHHGFTAVEGFIGGCNDANPTWSMDGMKRFLAEAVARKKPSCAFIGSVHAHHPWTVGDPKRFPIDKMVPPPHMVDGPHTRSCLSKHAAEVEERVKQMFEDLTISLKELNDPLLKKHAPPREEGDAMPVFDGMSAAGGKTYLSLEDGVLQCRGR